MQVTFYGTRGSLATPGPATLRYGGNTSCVVVKSNSGTLVMLDIGTGAAVLGRELMAKGGKVTGHIMIGHTHWDHIQGLPFFAPLFVPGNEWDVYAPRGLKETLRDTLAGQMEYTYFPVELDQLGATIRYHDLVEGTLSVGDIQVTAHYLNHPALTLGYRLTVDGATVVYVCDHEPHSRALATAPGKIDGQDARHAEFLADADLVIHDAQYLASEYAGKVGWGHSTVEYAVAIARFADAKRLALTHHDPTRNDAAVDAVLKTLKDSGQAGDLDVFAAAEGLTIELNGTAAPQVKDAPSAKQIVGSALISSKILIAMTTPKRVATMRKLLADEGLRDIVCAPEDAVIVAHHEKPGLIVLEDGGDGAVALGKSIRDAVPDTPLVLITADGADGPGSDGIFADHLVEPFSPSYARARLRAALMRRASEWARALKPHDEKQRIETLTRLNILDSASEERFDRITRLTAALFNVPMTLISLVDIERQWFKSACGIDTSETPRDESFCAHAVMSRKPMVIPDALLDHRFAENPLVLGGPRIRFYCGYPLIAHDGSCIGTLCLLDTRPREFEARGLALLGDMAQLVMSELEPAPAKNAMVQPAQ
jgi:phosphoribosyl 1,2-cyclic phosphodiesterase/DNA-binding response OmpR family regulator